jgi:WD40 repeat protein
MAFTTLPGPKDTKINLLQVQEMARLDFGMLCLMSCIFRPICVLWLNNVQDSAIRAWHEHTREVFSVDWSNIQKDTFASSSWDGNVKLVCCTPFSRG